MKKVSIIRTVYPIGYDLNNKHTDKAFNEWQQHISAELDDVSPMEKVMIEVKQILSDDNRR